MSQNDKDFGDFDSELEDEDTLDAHPFPGVEMLGSMGFVPKPDYGSGSYAEDGPIEVAEANVIEDGENMVGSAAMYGPTEIGDDEIGAKVARAVKAVKKALQAVKHAPPEVAAKHIAAAHHATSVAEHAVALGPYAQSGATEIGAGEDNLGADGFVHDEMGAGHYPIDGASELGSAAMYGPTEIGAGEDNLGADSLIHDGDEMGAGHYPIDGASELGQFAQDGASEIGHGLYPSHSQGALSIGAGHYPIDGASELGAGHYSQEGASEIGGHFPSDGASEIGDDDDEVGHDDEIMQPFETFMLEDDRLGDDSLESDDNWGGDNDYVHSPSGSEIGDEVAKAALVKVVEKARDNRQPAPPMKVVDVDAPLSEEDSFLSDIVIGAAVATGKDNFPFLSQLLLRAGSAVEPRIVRVDTEASYKDFRANMSPELSELRARFEKHVNDPGAHGGIVQEDIDDDISDLVHLGAVADEAEAEKRVEMWMPRRFDGNLEAWRQGDTVCASIALPGRHGDVRICTSFEPIAKCVEEMSRHAREAHVPPATVVGVIPAMGCVLGAGTVIKEMAAAAPAILARPEIKSGEPFMVRIEPKTSPNLAALVMLAWATKQGNAQAGDEWGRLGAASAPQVRQAMLEAVKVLKAAAGA
jgi:hypothetical protein